MKIFEILKEFELGDMLGMLYKDGETVSFTVIPAAMKEKIAHHRRLLSDLPSCREICQALKFDMYALTIESMAQLKLSGDGFGGSFAPGTTMRNSQSCKRMKFSEFRENSPGNYTIVFNDAEKQLRYEQNIVHVANSNYFTVNATIRNESAEAVILDAFPSFTIGCLSPFQPGEGTEQYKVHRWLSNWSNEGRQESRHIEEHNLEMSWAGFGERCLRFGQQGSMVTKGFFPLLAFEDIEHQVTWGASLEALGSWQLELSRLTDFFNLTGGNPDREFGQWQKTLTPGESFTPMTAAISCVNGSVDQLLARLNEFQAVPQVPRPQAEADMPVIFNEWCTSWGSPFETTLTPILQRLKGSGVKYFVLDAGWFNEEGKCFGYIGDWNIPASNYPQGLRAFTDLIRSHGMLPGIWFEFEVATNDSIFYREHPDWLLHLDGKILLSGTRGFLDFRKPEVIEYLDNKLIKMLRDNNFSYLKVDYNAPTGAICDGNEYKAEALREYLLAVEKYFLRIRAALPELTIEICSSGGHRLSPAWMRIGDMGSFSDAHEGIEIPIIAANTAKLIPMSHNQVWAVMRKADGENRLYYSLAAAFIGRFCISGDIGQMPENNFATMLEAIKYYQSISGIIKNPGINSVQRDLLGHSYVHAKGSQIFSRTATDGKRMLVVAHTFEAAPTKIQLPLSGKWKIAQTFKQPHISTAITNGNLEITGLQDFNGLCIELQQV